MKDSVSYKREAVSYKREAVPRRREAVSRRRERFVGALLGSHVGDALGMPLEGFSMDKLKGSIGRVEGLLDSRLGLGTYTDDTQMMIGVAESLIDQGKFDGMDMAWRFIRNFDITRGYGPGTVQTLLRIRKGTEWNEASRAVFPKGSYGNGSAMRVAPVGILYSGETTKLTETARETSMITHSHPLGICGAQLQAFAVGKAVELDPSDGTDCNRNKFLESLRGFSVDLCDPFPERMEIVRDFMEREPDDEEVITKLGNNVVSVNSVPTAIYCALRYLDDFRGGVLAAVNLGGDTDTIGAMTGAILGAYNGAGSIPEEWFDKLENRRKGRDYIISLAEKLYDLSMKME